MMETILAVGFLFLVLMLNDCVTILQRSAAAQERIAAALEGIDEALELACVDDDDGTDCYLTRIVSAQEKLADINPPQPKE